MMPSDARKILYVSGTRADFGLMRSTLCRISATPGLSLEVVATGMHLDPTFGETWREIESAGLDLVAQIKVTLSPATGATMAAAIGTMIGEFVTVFQRRAPDVVLVLGDRGEMLAAAIAAIHLNIPVAHIHGGERSGTVDESVRHAITKLAHLHFAATEEARGRIIALGENPDHVFVSGAPGLDDIVSRKTPSRDEALAGYGFDLSRPVGLILYHPVLQEAGVAARNARAVLDAVRSAGWQAVALMPNADAGSEEVRAAFTDDTNPDILKRVHLPRDEFITLMATVDAMIGNSSSGIIEAASFGTPVLNIGTRQNLRERNANVQDLPDDGAQITQALARLSVGYRCPIHNVYGDGSAADKICQVLADLPIGPDILNKVLRY
ncbi:MAG: UDP-N-acetylglucosamine 2-epimerase [Paracoccaceae bacterium]